MSELLTFIHLGFRHITDLEAMDHILFLVALAAIYRGRDWRESLWVVSAFTVGHSITLALAVTGAVRLPTALIEFLIPLTIVATRSKTSSCAIASERRSKADTGRSSRGSSVWCMARDSPTTCVVCSRARSQSHSSASTWGSRSGRSSCCSWRGSFWRCSTACSRSPGRPRHFRQRIGCG